MHQIPRNNVESFSKWVFSVEALVAMRQAYSHVLIGPVVACIRQEIKSLSMAGRSSSASRMLGTVLWRASTDVMSLPVIPRPLILCQLLLPFNIISNVSLIWLLAPSLDGLFSQL